MRARFTMLAAVLVLAMPGLARAWSLTADVWTGASRHDAMGIRNGLHLAEGDVLQGNFNATGMSAILKFGILEVGALWEGGLNFKSTQSGVVGPLLGFGFDPVSWLRLEALAEAGGHQFSNIGGSNGLQGFGDTSIWLPYVGFRPGVSLRLPVGPVKLVLGAWGFARWDMVKKEATVNIASSAGTQVTTYDVGGQTVGVEGRVGLEF